MSLSSITVSDASLSGSVTSTRGMHYIKNVLCFSSSAHCTSRLSLNRNRRIALAFINLGLCVPRTPQRSCQTASRTILFPHRRALNCAYRSPTSPKSSTGRVPVMGLEPETLPARHWITRSYGDINNLKLEDISVPPPGPKEIRINVRAVGMNFADCFAVLGLYDEAGPAPLTPGFEVSGVVESVGSEVKKHSVGDRVWALKRFGSYSTVVVIEEDYARPLKDDWTFEEGAAFPAQAFTAWYALCVLGAMPTTAEGQARHVTSPRRAVLVHSAAGGVGLHLLEMIRQIGGMAVCTVGNEEKATFLKERCGVPRERVIVRGVDDAKDNFETIVRERALCGEGGLDVVVDSVLGDYFAPGYELLNSGGRYIVMGSASLMPKGGVNLFRLSGWRNLIKLGWQFWNRPKLDLVGNIGRNRTVSGFNVLGIYSQVDFLVRGFDELEQMDLPKPLVGKRFDFDDTRKALEFFQSGRSMGKVVLVPSEKTG